MNRAILIVGFVFYTLNMFAAESPVILYEEDPTLLTSTIQVVVLTGSSDDPDKKQGLSNLMGEMITRGTKSKNRSTFQGEVEAMGATLGVLTSDDMTAFVGKVIKENTEAFFKLMQEALLQPAFSKAEFASLKKEVLADISHAKNSNSRLAGLALRREVFAGTPLALPGSGSLSTVKRVSLKDVQKVYKDEFHRGNFVFAIASPLKKSEFEKWINPFWKKFKKGEKKERTSTAMKIPETPKLVLVNKAKTSTGSLLFGQSGITATNDMRYELGVGNYSFGGEPLVSRLFRTIRSDLGWTYYIGSTYHAMGQLNMQQGLYVISTTPSIEFTTQTLMKVLDMWKKFLKEGLTKDELNLAKDSLVNSYPFEFDDAQERLWHKLRSYLYGTPVLSPEEYAKKIRGIDNKDVLKAVSNNHNATGWLVSLVADKDIIEKQLAEAQKDVPEKSRLKISKTYEPDELVK